MAYSELIKSFSRIRDYMREFYVYGLKAGMNTMPRAPEAMIMNGAGWKAGWGNICPSGRIPAERTCSSLWTAAPSPETLSTKVAEKGSTFFL